MQQYLGLVALVVNNYDEAIDFYVRKLNFVLVEDIPFPEEDKRWVVVRPPGSQTQGASLLLAQARDDEQRKFVGNQAGGRVFLFLYTDDFNRDYVNLKVHNVTIVRPPKTFPYGQVLVFEDLYGNRWDLIEPSQQ